MVFALTLPPRPDFVPPLRADDAQLEMLSSLYSLGANKKRLTVMAELAKGGELRFSDVLRLVTNPKLAQDSLLPLVEEGLVVHESKGAGYHASKRGLPTMMILTVGLGRILALVERSMEGAPLE